MTDYIGFMSDVKPLQGILQPVEPMRGIIDRSYRPAEDGYYTDGRLSPNPESNYQRIIRLLPDTFIQFKHPVFNGVQVLWQDAAGTIPVVNVGDNIGRAVCVVSGKAMVQVNPIWKPVWDGEKAAFSGAQYLIAENHDMGGFLHWHLPCQWILKSKQNLTPPTQYFLTTQSYGRPEAGVGCRYVNSGVLVYNRPENNIPNVGIYVYNTGAMDGEFHPIGYAVRDDRTWQITKDGARVGSFLEYPTSDLGDPMYPLVLGTSLGGYLSGDMRPSNNNSLVGDVEYLAIYRRALSQAETREHL